MRQLVQEAHKEISTARLEYTAERYQKARPVPQWDALDPLIPKTRAINERTHNRVVSVMDLRNGRERVAQKDLRDVEKLLSDNELTANEWNDLDQTVEYTTQGNRQLRFPSADTDFLQPKLLLIQGPGKLADKSGLLELGLIRLRELSDEWNPVLTESEVDEPGRVTLTLSRDMEGVRRQITYECDPALGYRYTRKQVTHAGKLRAEVTAGDYRDVDGRPFPFQFTLRRFDGNGELLEDSRYTFAKIQLDVELDDEDFKIQVPPGTELTNFISGGRVRRFEQGGHVGIEDALALHREQSASRK